MNEKLKKNLEMRKKVSKTMKERYASGKLVPWNKGQKAKRFKNKSKNKNYKPMSAERRAKISAAVKKNLPSTAFKKGTNNPNYKGDMVAKQITDQGYVIVLKKDHPRAGRYGYVREHILVMEEFLGRYLEDTEVVHHINEKRQDNRIENLMLFLGPGEHLKHHAWRRRHNL